MGISTYKAIGYFFISPAGGASILRIIINKKT